MTRQQEIAKARYTEIQRQARISGRPTDELLTLYALEGFLQRLVRSPHKSQFVLKGGVLLAAFQPRRPTRDIDLQGIAVDNDASTIAEYATSIASETLADGLLFDFEEITATVIRDADEYSGVRVNLPCKLHSAKVPFHLDVSVGDPILPAPQMIDIPLLLGGVVTLQGFPQPMVLAEKLVTAMQRGIANTRWRDFLDVYTLTEQPDNKYSESEIYDAIIAVAKHRKAKLVPIGSLLETFPEVAQTRWTAWLRKYGLTGRAPDSFAETLAAISAFCDPLILSHVGRSADRKWNPNQRAWS